MCSRNAEVINNQPEKNEWLTTDSDVHFDTIKLDVDELPSTNSTNISKDVSRSMLAERKILENWKGKSDSIVITNYDKNGKEIDTVVLSNKTVDNNDDTIPDEDNDGTASSYVLPQKQICIRKMSESRLEPRGRQEESSRGPKLKFDNKIESKSRSKSTRNRKPQTSRINNFNRVVFTANDKGAIMNINENYQPKIWSNFTQDSFNQNRANDLMKCKPPLARTHASTINIERVRCDTAQASSKHNTSQNSYNSLVEASIKLKKIASTITK